MNLELCKKVSARSLVVAPLVYSDNPVGVIKILSKHPNVFHELHVKILELMAGFIVSGLKHQLLFQEKVNAIKKLKRAQERLSHMAKHDFLTKLPNRKFFVSLLSRSMEKAKRNKQLIAVMYLDLDHFKWINDNLEHNMGDKLLVKFATFLKKNVRKYDLVVRLGGNVFVILFDDLSEEVEAVKIAEKIITNLNLDPFFNRNELKVFTSIGISFYRGEPLNPDKLVKQADEALYLAKSKGKNGYIIFKNKQ